jgi:hypothetical protein
MSQSVTVPPAPVRVPDKPHVQGPLLARRTRRTVAVLLALALLGMVPTFVDASPAWRAFGLGLVLPGGGFLYTADPLLVLVTLVLIAVGFLYFLFMRSNYVVIPAVWLATALAAAALSSGGRWAWATWAVPMALLAVLATVAVRNRVRHRRAQAVGQARNEYLAGVQVPLGEPVPTVAPELSPEDLATQRSLLDLALQPVDAWEGFDVASQFQMGAFRYQCNFPMWALALGQYVHTPAFQGYVNLAQRNLIEKMTERKVWEFWRYENFFGNLDPDPDPVRRENIMYSGYYSLMLEIYASNTGDLRYEVPGALPLRWNDKRTFSYDASSIAEAVVANFEGSGRWGMFACEPGILFPTCNALGLSALVIRDRRRGTDVAEQIMPAFRRTIDEELTTAEGTVVSNVFARFGFSNSLLFALAADANHGLWLSPLAPDITVRVREVLRREHVDIVGDHVDVRSIGALARRIDNGDPANTNKGPTFLLAMVHAFAIEAGDHELAALLRQRNEAEGGLVEDDGRRWFPKSSVFTNACWTLGVLGRERGWHDLVRVGMPESWRTGPALVGATYPDVLVARASTDGSALDLVLRPGAGGSRQRLRIERLIPKGAYRVVGAAEAAVTADEHGRADLTVDLDDRTEVQVLPVS